MYTVSIIYHHIYIILYIIYLYNVHQHFAMVRFHVLGDALVDVVCGGLTQLPSPEGDATAEHIALRAGATGDHRGLTWKSREMGC
jgi:hypothetical protein